MFEYQISIKDHRKITYWISKKIYKCFLTARTELEDMARRYIENLSGHGEYQLYNSKSKTYGKAPVGNFIATISMDKITIMHKTTGYISTKLVKLRTFTIMKRTAPRMEYVNLVGEVNPDVIAFYNEVVNEIQSKVKKVEPIQEEVHSNSNQQPN